MPSSKSLKEEPVREPTEKQSSKAKRTFDFSERVEDYISILYAEILSNIDTPIRSMAPTLWYGGKGMMITKLLPLLPSGGITYVEPFCGMASLFWAKEPHPVETLNDINGNIINLFRVLQDEETFRRFFHKILFTPYSLDELRRALEYKGDDPVERAWSFYTRLNQGFVGQIAQTEGNWGRSLTRSNRGMAAPANKLRCRMKLLASWHDRLTRVQLENRDGLDVIKYWDTEKTVFYIDPPYVKDTRASRYGYQYEMTDEQHEHLVDLLLNIKGKALVSGYDHPIYQKLEKAGWKRHEFKTVSFAVGKGRGSKVRGSGLKRLARRTEVAWVKDW